MPTIKAVVIPQKIEMKTAMTEARTDAAPFIPHIQGIILFDFKEIELIPIGKALPIKKPIKININKDNNILIDADTPL
jgi:hypothetical protein